MKSIKRILRVLGLLTFASLGVTVCEAQTPPTRIMPIGDSLTSGVSSNIVPGAYRNRLHSLLTTAGYNVDFVGMNTDSGNPTLPDKDHQGVGGARIDEIQAGVTGWLNSVEDPDVVLLLIGTNDFSQNFNTGSAQTRLTNLIADIATKRPSAKIIVSNLPLRTDSSILESQQQAFNAALPGIVNTQVSLGRQVSLVDMRSAWVAGDLVEGVHPNQGGYNKMADVWAPAIANVITPLGSANPPAIVRTGPPTTLQQLTVRFSKPLADSAATLANFSLNGGLSISAASLDASSKRIITLTTSTQTPGTLYTLAVTGVRDRTPAANLIANGSTIAFSTEAQNNGSFESDFAGWSSTGNMEIKNASPYAATNGSKLVAFNAGQLPPNGVLTQTFATTPGVPYVLSFDAGALGINALQRMQVTVSGSSTLVSQTISITGPGTFTSKWVPQSFSFVANTATTTMSFGDVSTTSDSVDLLLDNVRLTAQVPRTLTVSSTPTTGINVTLTPNDLNGAGGAPTGFSRQYLNGSIVTLTAPSVAGANAFVKWQRNGTDLTTNTSTTVTLDADYTLNAVYSANNQVLANGSFENGFTSWTNTGNQEIKNASPYLATDGSRLVAFNGGNLAPNGVLSQAFTTVPGVSYTLAFDAGVLSFNTSTQNLQVTATGSSSLLSRVVTLNANTNGTSRWFPQTFTFIANSTSTTLTFRDQSPTSVGLDLLLDNVRVTGPVGPVNNSPVAVADSYTANFNTALVVPTTGVLTNDTDTESNPLTAVLGTGPTSGSLTLNSNGSFTYTPNTGFSGTDSFTYRANDGNSNSNLATVTITVNGLAVGSLVNGSFESGETGWTFSGNYLVYASDGTYIALDGTSMVVLHGGPTSPNAVISQTFATTPGQTYQLSFGLGTFGGNGVAQTIQVALAGTTPILTQTESVTGTNSSTSSWSTKTISFTANSATTTLTFTDNSATTNAVDLLLDKVSIGIPTVNAAPVAVADSYSTNQNTALLVPAAGVLSNDTDGESNPLTAAVVANPTSGTLALSANGSFTYTPNTGYSGPDSFTYKANDGTSDSNTATVSITVIPPVAPSQLLVNGSFESLETGWTMTGNRIAYESDGTYVATNGTKLLVLSGGPTTPDAVISQTFTTIVGQTYTLTFDIGTVSINTAEQRLFVSVSGNASLLSQLVSVFGTNTAGSSWTPRTFSFVADSTSTTLSFSDLSPVSAGVDLLLDNVAVSGLGGPVNNPPVAVADTYTATQNTALVVAASGVLGNDTDTESNPLTASVVAGPTSGTLVLSTNGGFTYTPNTGYTGPDSFTYRANDGNSNSNTATVSITVNAGVIGVLVNGSFENNFTGWTTTGNQVIENASPYLATNGTKLVGFNGGNLLPNAVLSQSFGTVPGQTYTLAFDAGVLAFNTNPQRLNVTVNGAASLLNQNININGPGNGTNVWFPQSFTFVADSASTTLTFRDQSSSTAGLDLTLDNVRVTGPPAVNTAPVAVADSYTATQNTPLVVAAAGVLTNDTDPQGNPLTAISVSNPTSGSLTLGTNGGFTYTPNTGYTGPDSFTYKANDGLLDSNVVTVSITVNAAAPNNQLLVNGSFESNFSGWTTTGNQFIETALPYAATEGTKLAAFNGGNLAPNAVLSQSFATVTGQTYTLAFDAGVLGFNTSPQTLQATVNGTASLLTQSITINGLGNGTQLWVPQSFTFVADSTVTTLTFRDQSSTTLGVDLTLDNVRVNGPPGVPNTAPVAVGESYTTPQGTALVVVAPGVLANDTDAELSPLTAAVGTGPTKGTLSLNANGGFTYTPNSGVSGSDSFTYVANDGVLNSAPATVSITITPVSVGGLANGSFESGETIWSFSGNYLVYPSDGTYVAFNGTNLVVLHGGPTTPNAVISQSFATTPGSTYNLGFALGTVGGNGVTQSIKVDVNGTASLLSQTQSVTGTNSPVSVWTPQTLTFTADSAVTTLTFTDVSTATNGVDMLLDNVTVTLSGVVNSAPVAVADSYSTSPSTPLTIAAAGVLTNDTDANSDPLTAVLDTTTTSGTLALSANGGFTYTPNSGFTGTDSFTYRTNDTVADSNIVTVTISVSAPAGLVNGSFESNFTGWTTTGNVAIQSASPYLPTNGTKLAAFNSGNTAPNGVLSQSFATVSGTTYTLAFDAGALAYNTSTQRLQVNVTGTGSLLSQLVTTGGIGGGNNNWISRSFTFVANSTTTTLSFTDTSTTGAGLDLLLDKVSITGPAGPAPTTATLTVNSTPSTGVSITVSPVDNATLGNGTTNFTRTYNTGTVVSLTAPATSGVAPFVKWQKDGADFAVTPATTVTLSANTTLTAIYQAGSGATLLVNGSFESDFSGWTKTGNINIESTAPYTFTDGVKLAGFNGIDSTPNGVLSQTFATTPGTSYVLTFDAGVLSFNTNPQSLQVGVTGTGSLLAQTLTLTRTGGSNNLWLPQSFTFVANSASSTVSFTDASTSTIGLDLVLDNVKVVVNGSAPTLQTLTVNSSPVTAAISVSPSDSNGNGNGTTSFGRAYAPNTVVSLTAPAVSSGVNFVKWQRNGVDFTTNTTASVTMDASYTLTAIYGDPPFSNGSFETGTFAPWTTSGGTANSVRINSTLAGTNGTKLVEFNASQSPNGGILSQTFVTTPGVTYSLAFDLGVIAFNTSQQSVLVNVNGTSSLLSQTATINGINNGTVKWEAKAYSFTANSATTTLTFTDTSTITNSIDLLLDNVRVSNANARTLTIDSVVASAVALTISPADNTGAANGNALLTRSYNVGTVVSVTAPATGSNGATFAKWVRDGVDYAVTAATTVTVSSNTSLVAVYTGGTFPPLGNNIIQNGSFEANPDFNFWATSGATRIEKPGSATGFPTNGNNILSFNVGGGALDGAVEQSFTTTPGTTYTLQLDVGSYGGPAGAAVSQTLNIGVVGSSTLLSRTVTVPGSTSVIPWQPQTFNFTANSTTTILYLSDGSSTGNATDLFVDNVRVRAGTLAPSTLTVTTTPTPGKAVTVSPVDLANQGNGSSNFTRIYPTGSTIQMVAPFANFVKWLKNGQWYATNPSITLTLDGNHTFTAVYTDTPVVGPFTNGSFEGEFTGWTWSGGQQTVKVKDGLPTTDGIFIIEFNSNSSGLDGAISQTFTTTPGTVYNVTFDMGVNAFNTAQQRLKAEATGTGVLASQIFSMNGINGQIYYEPKAISFTANSATTTLTFSDQSSTGVGLDLLLDNVKVNGSTGGSGGGSGGGGGGNPVLTVDSVGASNVAVTVSPLDSNNAGNGNTLLTRTYTPGTVVSLTAPASGSGGSTFTKWVKDGVDYAATPDTTVTLNSSTTLFAVYTGGTGVPLGNNILANGSFESLGGGFASSWSASNGSTRIEQPGSATGFPTDGNNILSFNVGGTPTNGVAQQTFFTTPGTTYTLQLDVGSYGGPAGAVVNQTLNIGVIGSSTLLSRSVTVPGSTAIIPWRPQTFTFTANSTTTNLILADGSSTSNGTDLFVDNVRVRAGALAPSTITVVSTPTAGKTVTVSPVDLAAQGNGTTSFTRTYATGSSIQMVAPFANFVKWLKNGQWYATNPTISVVVDGNHTFTAVYTTTPVLGPFTNGSFEGEFTGWTWSGSQQSVKVKDGLPSTDGINIIEFNSNSSGLDGSISQTFTTTPGTVYTVAFDMGVNAFNTAQQSLRAQVTGSGVRVSQTFSMNNPAGNGILYSARSVTFTANSPTSTLTFSDQSATGAGLDLLLDNVRVTAQLPNPGNGGSNLVVNAPAIDTPVPQIAPETVTPEPVAKTIEPKATTGVQVTKGKKHLVLTVVKATLPAGASPVIEVSSDLKTWFSGPAHTTVIKDNAKILTVRDNTPVRPGAKRYIRLKPLVAP